MTEIVLKKDWRAPYPSNWRNNFHNFVEACQSSEVAKMEAQYFFSHIIRTEEWREEMVWEDWVTGKIYESEEGIPDDAQTISKCQRWKNQQEFLGWCDNNILGFATSTFWARHRTIDKWVEVGMDLVDAVKIVAGLSARTPSDLVLEVFNFNEYHHCLGFKPELAKKLPTLSDDAREAIEELSNKKKELEDSNAPTEDVEKWKQEVERGIEEHFGEVARAAEEYIKEKSFPLEKRLASPRTISRDIRKEIVQKPHCKVRYTVDDVPYHFVWVIEWPGDTGYTEKTEKIYLQLISEDGEILSPDNIHEDAMKWWNKKMGLFKQLQQLGG